MTDTSSPGAWADKLRAKWASPPPPTPAPERIFAHFCAQGAWGPAMDMLRQGAWTRFPDEPLPAAAIGLSLPVLPIQMLAKAGCPQALRLALWRGADPNGMSAELSCSPLLLALSNLDLESVQALLDAGADPNGWAHAQCAPRSIVKRRSPLSALCAMAARRAGFGASQWGDLEDAQATSPWDPEFFDRQTRACCEALLDAGAEIDARDERGESALCLAVNGACPQLAAFLISRGASLEAPGFCERGFVGQYCADNDEWVGGDPKEWGLTGPIDSAIDRPKAHGALRILIDAGAQLTPKRIEALSRRAQSWRSMSRQLEIPVHDCPWMALLAYWEARLIAPGRARPGGPGPRL